MKKTLVLDDYDDGDDYDDDDDVEFVPSASTSSLPHMLTDHRNNVHVDQQRRQKQQQHVSQQQQQRQQQRQPQNVPQQSSSSQQAAPVPKTEMVQRKEGTGPSLGTIHVTLFLGDRPEFLGTSTLGRDEKFLDFVGTALKKSSQKFTFDREKHTANIVYKEDELPVIVFDDYGFSVFKHVLSKRSGNDTVHLMIST